MPYFPSVSSGNNLIAEMTADPVTPSPGYSWILDTGAVGSSGQAMGVLGLTYSRQEVNKYRFCMKMHNGDTKRVVMS